MAAVVRLELSKPITDAVTFRFQKPNSLLPSSSLKISPRISSSVKFHRRQRSSIVAELKSDADADNPPNNEEDDVGVKVALSMLRFYKREISPLLPNSCRYIPTCSEYSMEAYKRYGVVKGTVLTAWRLCRCNPLGGSGFDPPRWFDEERRPGE